MTDEILQSVYIKGGVDALKKLKKALEDCFEGIYEYKQVPLDVVLTSVDVAVTSILKGVDNEQK